MKKTTPSFTNHIIAEGFTRAYFPAFGSFFVLFFFYEPRVVHIDSPFRF